MSDCQLVQKDQETVRVLDVRHLHINVVQSCVVSFTDKKKRIIYEYMISSQSLSNVIAIR